MAEAKLKAVIAADASQFERALEKVKEQAKELGKGIGEVGNDLGKGLTGLDIGKLLGIGGAIYAATKLGDALIDAAKEGYKAFQVYQDAVLKFKYNAPSSAGTLEERGKLGEEMAETAESKVGIFSFTQLSNAGIALEQVANELKLSPEKINGLVDTMQALAIKSGTTPDAIAENFRKLVVSIKEEGSGAVGKFFKATPGLEEEAGKLRDAHAEAYLQNQGANASGAAQQAEYAKLLLTPIAEFMTQESQRVGGRGILEEVQGVMERSAPKSITTEEQDIHPEAALNAEMEKLSKSFGEDLAPAVREATKGITEALPTLRDDFKEIGDVLKLAVIPAMELFGSYLQAIGGRMNLVGGILGDVLTKLFPFSGKTETSESVDAKLTSMGLNPDTVLSDKRPEASASTGNYRPYGDEHTALEKTKIEAEGSFNANEGEDPILAAQRALSLKTQTDVDAINLKAANEHIASQRARDFQAASTGYLDQAKNAAQQALSRINPADKSEHGKENTITQEAESKRIGIKAEAAQKSRQADEDSALKIAKIQEEIGLRDIERKADKAKDQTKELDAKEAERKAKDAAAQQQIDDLIADAAQKKRDADLDSAQKILDLQEESARKINAERLSGASRASESSTPAGAGNFINGKEVDEATAREFLAKTRRERGIEPDVATNRSLDYNQASAFQGSFGASGIHSPGAQEATYQAPGAQKDDYAQSVGAFAKGAAEPKTDIDKVMQGLQNITNVLHAIAGADESLLHVFTS